MAADLAGADALLNAAEASGRAADGELADGVAAGHAPARSSWSGEGVVGEPVQVSHRGGHVGPREYGCSPQFCDWLYDAHQNGGGALVDYCGYGALLTLSLLGRPPVVTAVAAHLRKEGLAAEDNAIVILKYPAHPGPARRLLDPHRQPAAVRPDRLRRPGHAAGAPAEGDPRGRHGRAGSDRVVDARRPRDDRSAAAAGRRHRRPDLLPDPRPRQAADRGPALAALGRDVQEVLAAALWSSQSGREVWLKDG